MAKQTYKYYIEPKDFRSLMQKAKETGFVGKGAMSHFLAYLSNNDLIFLDANVKKMIRALQNIIIIGTNSVPKN